MSGGGKEKRGEREVQTSSKSTNLLPFAFLDIALCKYGGDGVARFTGHLSHLCFPFYPRFFLPFFFS
jgi:hypothetical protein